MPHYNQTKVKPPFWIYKITNLINEKVYIGLTTGSVEDRWKEHVNASTKSDARRLLILAIREFGKENFKIETIAGCDSLKGLRITERRLIIQECSKIPIGYNMVEGGAYRNRVIFDDKTLKSISRKVRAYSFTLEGNAARRRSMLGYKHTDKSKSKMSESKKGIKFTEKHKRNLRKAQRKRFSDPKARELSGFKNRRFTDEQIKIIFDKLLCGVTVKSLCKEFSITRGPLNNHFNRVIGKDWRKNFPNWSSRAIFTRWRKPISVTRASEHVTLYRP